MSNLTWIILRGNSCLIILFDRNFMYNEILGLSSFVDGLLKIC